MAARPMRLEGAGEPCNTPEIMVTIQDVAKAAGVSPMTVSHVLNDHPHVKSTTRAKVLEVIDELDYRVNVAARNLRTGRTNTIGLAVPEIDRPYFGQLAAAIIRHASAVNLHVVIEQTGASRENELNALAQSRKLMYDGLILSTVGLGQSDADLLPVDYPVVLLGERIFDGPVDHVAMPNVEGARAATEALIAAGCRRIAIVRDADLSETGMSSLRFAGYQQALQAAGIEFDPELAVDVTEYSLASGFEVGMRLAQSSLKFDAVFCITDVLAIGLLRAFAVAAIAVPERVKVIGFDNIELDQYMVPTLSSVDPDHDLMAKTAVSLLNSRIAGNSRTEQRDYVGSFSVISRESTSAKGG